MWFPCTARFNPDIDILESLRSSSDGELCTQMGVVRLSGLYWYTRGELEFDLRSRIVYGAKDISEVSCVCADSSRICMTELVRW